MIERKLNKLGLNKDEITVYKTLLKYGVMSGKETMEKSGLGKAKVELIILELSQKGLVNILERKTLITKAVDPNIALEKFIQNSSEDLEKTKVDVLKEIDSFKRHKIDISKKERITVYTGDYYWDLVRHMDDMLKKERKAILPYDEIEPRDITRMKYEMMKKKKKIHTIVTKNTRRIKLRTIEEGRKGAKFKYYPIEGMKLIVDDKKIALLQVTNPRIKSDKVNIIIENAEFVKSLNFFFANIWKKGKNI